MCFSLIDCEDVMFSENIDKTRNSLDCFSCSDLDGCYQNILSHGNYNSYYMHSSSSCIDSSFLYDCVNCQNCCLSSNLRNGQYYFNNQKLSKEDYKKAVEELKLNSYEGVKQAKEYFDTEIYKSAIHKYANIISSDNVVRDYVTNSKNVFKSFDVSAESEDIRYSNRIIKSKDMMDIFAVLSGELAYDCIAPSNGSRQIVCIFCIGSKNIEYSLFCKNSSDCFACVGLNNAKYCILNKQYSKEEYEELSPKLKELMNNNPYIDSKNRIYKYGEFYPFEMCPFGYNETVALDYVPVSKEEAITMGYPWYDREKRDYAVTLNSADLPDSINDVDSSILNETISCPNDGHAQFQCTSAFRITPEELQFYQIKKIPLPRFCPNCRHYERLNYRNAMKLYDRECSNNCGTTFKTTYSSDKDLKVYCEKCYQKEVL